MKSILKQARVKNIERLYNIKKICPNGIITIYNKNIIIYKVEPANIISCDENIKNKIYQAYMTCIRGMPNVFQIVICNSKDNFEQQIKYYKMRLLKINNNGLKQALAKYINHLEKLSKQAIFNKTKHYLIIDECYEMEVTDTFTNIKQLGVSIERVSSKGEVQKVLREAIIKERSG